MIIIICTMNYVSQKKIFTDERERKKRTKKERREIQKTDKKGNRVD